MTLDVTHASLLAGTGLFCAVGARCARTLNNWWQQRTEQQAASAASLANFDAALLSRKQQLTPEPQRINVAWRGYRRFVIDRTEFAASNTKSFYLIPEDGRKLPPYLAGQYLTLRLPVPSKTTPLVRCYSLSDRAHSERYRITVKLAGVVSRLLHDNYRAGSIVEAQAPRGDFFWDPSEQRPLVLIASGIGITPIFSMITTVLAQDPTREITLFYGARNRQEHTFHAELCDLARQHKRLHYIPCYSQPGLSDRFGVDYLLHQRIDMALIKKMLRVPEFPIYLCGPGTFMETLVPELLAWGCAEDDVHYEAFGPSTVKKSDEPAAVVSTNIRVTLEQSQQTLAWSPDAHSILDLAERQGITLPSGCRSGNCGMCAMKLKAGQVRYATKPAADVQAGHCLTCVAAPTADITLEA
jgi:uncharacterized protein